MIYNKTTPIFQSAMANYYSFLFVKMGDPRTCDWILMKDPFNLLAILTAYLYFVLKWGPKLMRNRKPFELKTVLIVYNFMQVLISTYIFWEALEAAWWNKYSWKCEPVDYSWSPHAMRVARAVHVYFLTKILELLDTVFFVLRKKYAQITFLHLYHHTIMAVVGWGGVKYLPGGHGTFIGLVNSFVHIIMYFYYLVAAMGPRYQGYLWWKKYITNLQMVQFCVTFVHNMQLLFHDCGYPKWILLFILPNSIFFYFLFLEFYNGTYTTGSGNKAKVTLRSHSTNISKNTKTKFVYCQVICLLCVIIVALWTHCKFP